MTELEKRLKHIENTNAKRTDNYRKLQQQANENFNKIRQNKQKSEVKKAIIIKSSENKKTNVKISPSKGNKINKENNIIDGSLERIENNYLNNYISQRNYNDENARVFTKEHNQRKADALKSNINKIIRRQSNQNRLNELEVEEANLKKRDGRNNIVEPLAEDYDKIEKNKNKQQKIDDERKAIKSGYNAPINVSDDNLYSAWFIHNYKDNLEKNAERSLHDENVKLNNQQSKVRNAVNDTLMQDRREQISKVQKSEAEQLKKDLETQGFNTYQEMEDYNKSWKGTLSYIGRSALNSLAHFNKNITTDVRDFLGIREELNDLGLGFLNDIADYYGGVADNDDEYLASKSKYVGKGTQIAGEGAKIVAQMAPQIAFALMSGGSSAAISTGETLGNATSSAKVLSSLKTMAKQPTFWTSVIQEGGNAYEEAKQNGASQEDAQLSAIYTGLINATIEMGGGIEDGTQKGLKKLIKVGNEEGLEEVKQDLVSGLTSKSIYDKDKPLFSTENDNAVINPGNEIKSYLGGFFGGTVGAGIQQGAATIANKISDKKHSKDKDIYNAYQEQLLGEQQNANQTDDNQPPTVETVFLEAETNQEKAKRLAKIINKIDSGETVADSEIVELKYNKTASNMLEQMAGLKESKITSSFNNEKIREVINLAQNGKKNIDTVTILNNIKNNTDNNQNYTEIPNENSSEEALNADEGNLINANQVALQDATEPNMTSHLNEVSEAMPKNITLDDEADIPNSNTNIDNDSNNLKSTFKRVVHNSNKIMNLGISSEKTGSTNIRKVKSVDNGVVQLLMTNGEVIPSDAIDFSDNKNAEIILSNAGKYNSNTASTFIANYDSNTSTAENYSIAFNSVYRMAEKGLSIDTIVSQTRGARAILGEKTFNAAINACRNTANGTFADNTTKVTSDVKAVTINKPSVSKNKNININAKSKPVEFNVRQAAKSLSTALGVKINVYNSDTSIRGYEQNGEVFINESYVNSKANSYAEFNFILAHELTHTLEQSNYYDQLKTFILNSLVYDDFLTSRDTTHREEISKRQELYENNGKVLTKEEAERELIADFIADELMTNEECIRDLAYKNEKLFAKVVDFIHKMIDNLKRFVRNSKEITAAQKDLIHIKELYTKAFNDVKKNGTYSNEVKYSKKLGGYNPDIRVTTDNVLKEYGIKNIRNVTDVINKVCLKLSKSYLSSDNVHKPVTNIDTGLKIEIRKSGIKETFGKPTYYKSLSNDLKLAKIASMSELAKMIKYGEVRAKDASNYHDLKSRVRFSYLKSSINIDGINYDVTMDIKRLPNNDNIFYIHDLKIKKQETNSVHRTANGLKVNLPLAKDNISHNDDIVNSNIRKNSENDTQYSIDPDVESQMKALNEQYGTKKKGENPVRDIDVPERSSKDKRVREFVKTILESGALTDEMVNEVDKQIVKGAASYLPLSNENALKIAKEWLDNKGKGVTEKQWNDWEIMKNRHHKVSALDVAKGELLLRYAAQNNDTKKVIQLTGELAEMATTAGQTVQAMRLLKKSSGIGKLYYIEKYVNRMNADYQAKYANKLAKGKDIPQITIDEDLALKLAQAKTQTEIEEAETAITKNIGEQVPATWIDKWNAWRYMSMLFNPTTHIRNIVGNTIFMPAVSMKNGIAYGLEKAFLKGDIEKSKALKVKSAYKEFAKQDFDYVKAELTGNGKYETTDEIKANKVVYKNKILEGLRNFNTNLLEAEDGIFLKHHYERALGMYLQSNNISLNELSDENAESERQAAIDRGRVWAIKEAQKATYRDASKIADTLSRIAKTNLATEVIVEGIIPFKKTPVNIAKRAAEYSPIGLVEALSRESVKLKKGEITASEFIDRISAGLTGSAIYALGLCLGSIGLLKVGLGDDDKERDFEKLKGHQEFSVEILGYSYTFDWACPAAIPLFVGAKTHEILEKDNSGLTGADYQDLVGTMFDPMFEMSVLSGIDNLINNVKYSESPVIDTGLYSATSYLGQAVPTIGGKIASTIDETSRSSYIDKSKDTLVSKLLTSSQQQFVNKIIKKIPGATYLLEPYVNEWGEQEKENNIGMRIFKNFISPGYVSKIEVDEVEKMLDDTYRNSGDPAVLPTKSKKYFSLGGKTINLTSDDYTTYATVRGQIAHSILSDFSKKSEFKSADSSDKVTLITQSYELSNAIAKQGVSDYEPDGWIRSAIQANEKGMSYADFIISREQLSGINGEGTNEKIYNRIKRMNISKSEKEVLWLSFYDDMTIGGKRIYF